jgi:allantoicase
VKIGGKTFRKSLDTDVFTTAKLRLGHSDGGALAMKVYGHLRREHSASMAQRVTFGQTT